MIVFSPSALRSATASAESLFRVSDRTAKPTVLPSTPARTTVYPSSLTFSAAASVPSRFPGHISLIRPSFPATTVLPPTFPDTPRPGRYSKSDTSRTSPTCAEAIALPKGCSERDSTAETIDSMSSASVPGSVLVNPWQTMSPVVSVPVLSISTVSTDAILSTAPPSWTSMPRLDMLPAAAMMAVGVARIRAQGQNTTSTVTDLYMSWNATYDSTATVNAMTTMYTAQRSAVRTTLDFPASAFSIILAILAMVVSSPTRSTSMSTDPYMFTVPEDTRSPTATSRGTDSPVRMELFTDVVPETTTPSTGTISPGTMRTMSPRTTSSAGTMVSVPSLTTLAVAGFIPTSLMMLALAWLTVASSRKPPICMIMAISAAASYSPMSTDATMATETSTSAVMSCSFTTPTMAPQTMGAPQMAIGTKTSGHAQSATNDDDYAGELDLLIHYRVLHQGQANHLLDTSTGYPYIYPVGVSEGVRSWRTARSPW